jgi:hypothetical protein
VSGRSAIELATDIIERYRISALHPLIETCRAFEREGTLNVLRQRNPTPRVIVSLLLGFHRFDPAIEHRIGRADRFFPNR